MATEGGIGLRLFGRRLSVAVFSLFFSWMLAFSFEGRILYSIAELNGVSVGPLVFGAIAFHFAGLVACGFFVRTAALAKRFMLFSIAVCFACSGVFLFEPSFLWKASLYLASFLVGCCVAAWGFCFKNSTPREDRIKTMADGLIFSNLLMILLNMACAYISPRAGLILSMLALAASFFLGLGLPGEDELPPDRSKAPAGSKSIAGPLAFLCLFIVVITINSGLMYQVQGPAFAHLEWLTAWYWALPYILALAVMRNLSGRVNRSYILYVAIAMIGFSFIAFLLLDRSAASYIVVNTLMLAACGVYDLFWWSILGDMLDMDKNPARILGIGLSANVLGVFLGGMIGKAITGSDSAGYNPTLLALGVVCLTLVMLPPLHKRLTGLLKSHIYLTEIFDLPLKEQRVTVDDASLSERLTGRELEIASLLLTGKTYRMIAGELHVSENTIKTHVKNIYSKAGVQSRTELIGKLFDIRPHEADK